MADPQWYGLVDPVTGDLVSTGTIEMFPEMNVHAFDGQYNVIQLPGPPDFAKKVWNKQAGAFADRPAPVFKDRRDDLDTALLANPDFAAVWDTLNAARKVQLRRGIRDVVGKMLGGQVLREENQSVDL